MVSQTKFLQFVSQITDHTGTVVVIRVIRKKSADFNSVIAALKT